MTTWVMMPVPEEFEPQVRQMVMWLGLMANTNSWNAELIAAHLGALADDARTLACAVAQSVVAGHAPEDAELAEEFGLSVRELLGLAQEVNDVTVEPFPGALLHVRREKIADQEGGGYRRVLHMEPIFADAVCEWAATHEPVGVRGPTEA